MHSLSSSCSVGIAGLLVSFGALAGACSNGGDEGLLITKNVAVVDTPGDCVFTGLSTEPFLPHGFVDALADGYLLHPQFQSRISIDTTDPTTVQDMTTARTVIMTDADIDISFPDTTLFTADQLATMKSTGLTHFKELFSVPVLPEGTADAEIEVIHRPLIEAVLQVSPTADVEMLVEVVGNGTMSGQSVSSSKFSYPVTLTNTLAEDAGPCPLPSTTSLLTGNPCNVFQDAPVTCCEQNSTTIVCPGTLATTFR